MLDAMLQEVSAEAKRARAALEAALRAARPKGVRSVEARVPDPLGPDGSTVAATYGWRRDAAPTVVISDMQAAIEWVGEHHPHQIREVIDPTFQQALLADTEITEDGEIVNGRTGELMPDWLRVVRGAPGVMFIQRGDDSARKALVRRWIELRAAQERGGALPGGGPAALGEDDR